MIQSFMDDTADTENRFVGFGGFAGKREAWESIEGKLSKLNERNGIGWFHATNYSLLVPQYIEATVQCELFLIGYTLDRMTYREYAKKSRRDDFGINEWASSASGAMGLIADFMINMPDERCALFVDCRGPYRQSIQDCFYVLNQWRDNAFQLSSLTVPQENAKKEFPLFQIADLGANVLCKHTRVKHYGSCEDDPLARFIEKQRCFNTLHVSSGNIETLADMVTAPLS